MDTPVICALNGSAAGYGMDMALGCDIRVMADDAKLSAAFTRRGVLPESGGTWILPRLIGWSRAAEIIFTGRTLSAAECLEMGLVSRVVPRDRVLDEARSIADDIATNAPLAVKAAKRMMRMGLDEPFDRARAPRLPAAPPAAAQRRRDRGHEGVPREARRRASRVAEPRRCERR